MITGLETALGSKAGALVDELLRMRVTISEGAGKVRSEVGGHDDLVLATALAVWRAKRGVRPAWGTKSLGLE